jgi:hypothetical protein
MTGGSEELTMTSAIRTVPAVAAALLLAASSAGGANLVNEWRFDGDGTDSVGTADGTVGSIVTFDSGVPCGQGQAAVFGPGVNGSTDDEIVTSSPSNIGLSDVAFAFWVRRDTLGGPKGVFDAHNAQDRGVVLLFGGDNQIRVGFTFELIVNYTLNIESNPAMITDSEWHHVVFCLDRSSNLASFYLDGVLFSVATPSLVIEPVSLGMPAIHFGTHDDENGLDGALALFQYYKSVLTQAEITELASRKFLAHEYEFAGDATDLVGTADGTVGASVGFGSGGLPPNPTAVFGSGIGASDDDEIIVPMADFMNFGVGDFSISFWVRRNDVDSGNADGVFDALDGTGTGWQMAIASDNKLTCRIDDDGGATINLDSTGAIVDSNWHHVVLSVDRSETDGARWYIDGALDVALDPTSVPGAITPDQDLHVGAQNNVNGMEGELLIAQFYCGALTAPEVAALAGVQSCAGDANADGAVDVNDITYVLFRLGNPCP